MLNVKAYFIYQATSVEIKLVYCLLVCTVQYILLYKLITYII